MMKNPSLFQFFLLIPYVVFLNPFTPLQSLVINSMYYIDTLIAFDRALKTQSKLPYFDLVPFGFTFLSLLIEVDYWITFGFIAAYYLTKFAVLLLKKVK